jgi:hypothetical protein
VIILQSENRAHEKDPGSEMTKKVGEIKGKGVCWSLVVVVLTVLRE